MLKSTLKIIIIFTLTSHIVAEQDYPCWQRGGIKDTTLSICDSICCCGDKALGEKQLCQNITTSEGTSAVIQEGTIQGVCNDKPYLSNQGCCVDTIYDTATHGCCESPRSQDPHQTYKLKSEKCCPCPYDTPLAYSTIYALCVVNGDTCPALNP